MPDRRNPGWFNRKVELLRPVTVENDFNESQTSYEPAYSGWPARRLDKLSSEDENVKGNAARSILSHDWELRFAPNLELNSKWQIRDMLDGKIYQVVAPVSEVDFRVALLVKTEIVE